MGGLLMTCEHETYSLSYQSKKDGVKKYHKTKFKFCSKCEFIITEVAIWLAKFFAYRVMIIWTVKKMVPIGYVLCVEYPWSSKHGMGLKLVTCVIKIWSTFYHPLMIVWRFTVVNLVVLRYGKVLASLEDCISTRCKSVLHQFCNEKMCICWCHLLERKK